VNEVTIYEKIESIDRFHSLYSDVETDYRSMKIKVENRFHLMWMKLNESFIGLPNSSCG